MHLPYVFLLISIICILPKSRFYTCTCPVMNLLLQVCCGNNYDWWYFLKNHDGSWMYAHILFIACCDTMGQKCVLGFRWYILKNYEGEGELESSLFGSIKGCLLGVLSWVLSRVYLYSSWFELDSSLNYFKVFTYTYCSIAYTKTSF